MTKRVLVPIADGSEEIETTCITDTLTRCGAQVTVASVMPNQLTCTMSRGIKVRGKGTRTHRQMIETIAHVNISIVQVVADIPIEEAISTNWDLVVLPGGMPGTRKINFIADYCR